MNISKKLFILPLFYLYSCSDKAITTFSGEHVDTCVLVNTDQQKMHGALRIKIITNDLDDTAIIYSIKVPPKKTGEIFYTSDYYNNEVSICFKKFKAKKGSVSIACEF